MTSLSIRRWIISLALGLAAATALAESAQQWRDDLHFMVAEMQRRHPNLYHASGKDRFDAAVAELDARIPSLQRHEIIVGMMRIAALVGDGHTRIDPRKDTRFGFPSLPLKLYLFEEGLFVRAAIAQHAELVGARVEAIGGVPIEEAMRRAAEISSHDNEFAPRLFIPLYLNMPHVLHALKLSETTGAAVLTLRKGDRTWDARVPAGAVEPPWPPDTDISLVTPPGWVDARTTPRQPMWLQEPLAYHRIIDLPEQRALYVQLNMVTGIDGQTLDQFAARIAERARALKPRALVLDLRLNQGGNGDLRTGLVRELVRLDPAIRLFVLTGRGTFSASQFILDDLDRLTDAVFIGEPASSKPSSYGDAYRTLLPNSGIAIRTSIKWWQAGQNMDPWTWVDVAAPLTFAAYAAGRDPALEAAVAYAPQAPLAQRLAALGTIGEVQAMVAAYLADPRNRYADRAGALADAAEELHTKKHSDAALAVARIAVREFTNHLDAHAVLVLVAAESNQPALAREAAARALQIDPNNRFIRALLEKL